jgi:hypothetical protein
MQNNVRPNERELQFLTLAYNRFYDIFDEIMDDTFWEKDAWYRFFKVKDGFGVYSELMNYEPLQWVLDDMKISRPPMEAEIAKELFKFIRNIISHFPFFDRWEDVWINKSLINWHREGQFIDNFINKYEGKEPVKYRFWEEKKKKMTYLSIRFPEHYADNTNIYLKDILSEKEGVKFSFILMNQVLNTQVENVKEKQS